MTPKMAEVKYCYQSIRSEISETGFRVINKFLFTGTDAFDCFAMLMKNGILVEEKPVVTSVPPLSEAGFDLPFAIPDEPGEYCIAVSFRLKEDECWAIKGYEIACDQKVFAKGSAPCFGWGSGSFAENKEKSAPILFAYSFASNEDTSSL